MNIGKVIGTVVSSQKVPKFQGLKLLMVQPYVNHGGKLEAEGPCVVSVDCVGAGIGELVMYTQGSSARMTDCTKDVPADAVIVGIVDNIEIEGHSVKRP